MDPSILFFEQKGKTGKRRAKKAVLSTSLVCVRRWLVVSAAYILACGLVYSVFFSSDHWEGSRFPNNLSRNEGLFATFCADVDLQPTYEPGSGVRWDRHTSSAGKCVLNKVQLWNREGGRLEKGKLTRLHCFGLQGTVLRSCCQHLQFICSELCSCISAKRGVVRPRAPRAEWRCPGRGCADIGMERARRRALDLSFVAHGTYANGKA